MRPAFQIGVGFLVLALFALGAGFWLVTRVADPGLPTDALLFSALAAGCALLPLASLWAPAVTWYGWDGGPERTSPPAERPLLVALLAGALSISGAWVGSDFFLLRAADLEAGHARAALDAELRARRDVRDVEIALDGMDAAGLRKTEERLRELAAEFPYQIDLPRTARKVARALEHKESGDAAERLEKEKKSLEEKAVRLRNQGDFDGAAQAYRLILAQMPAGTADAAEREEVALSMETALSNAADRGRVITEEQIAGLRRREVLEEIDRRMAKGETRALLDLVRSLAVRAPKDEEVRSRYSMLEKKLREEDFEVTDLRHDVERGHFLNVESPSWTLSNGVLTAEFAVLADHVIWLLEPRWQPSPDSETQAWKYGRWSADRIQVKSSEEEESKTLLRADEADHRIPLLMRHDRWRPFLPFLSPMALSKTGEAEIAEDGGVPSWFSWAALVKWGFPLSLLIAAAGWMALGWRARDHLLSPSFLLFLPIGAALLAFLPLYTAQVALAWASGSDSFARWIHFGSLGAAAAASLVWLLRVRPV